jgi:hypothetical protein
VIEPRRQQKHIHAAVAAAKLPVELERRRRMSKPMRQFVRIGAGKHEYDAHEEAARMHVVELTGFDDVSPRLRVHLTLATVPGRSSQESVRMNAKDIVSPRGGRMPSKRAPSSGESSLRRSSERQARRLARGPAARGAKGCAQ